ncbi:hypothetical protein D3C76_1061020 [compost metagenome]
MGAGALINLVGELRGHHVVALPGRALAVQLHVLGAHGQHDRCRTQCVRRLGMQYAGAAAAAGGLAVAGQVVQREQVHLAQELGDETALGAVVDVFRGVDLGQLAVVENRDARGQRQRFVLVVGDEHETGTDLTVDALQLGLQLFAQVLVQRRQWLVEQQKFRLEHQRPGNRHALLLAAGHLGGFLVHVCTEADHFKDVLDPAIAFFNGDFADAQRVGHVVGHAHVREQRITLEHHAVVPLLGGAPDDVDALLHQLARGRAEETGQNHQQGGFARAGRTQQGKKFTLANVEIDVIQRRETAVILADTLSAELNR